MKQVFATIVLVLLAVLPAHAETLKLSYVAEMHVRTSHAEPVLDDERHMIGIAAFNGVATFEDLEPAPGDVPSTHRYEGWFDLTNGSGPFHGYAVWQFDGGSEIRAAYDGKARATDAGGVHVQMQFRDITGTGRFAGATGEGEATGERIDPISEGGVTHLEGRLTLTLPN